MHRRSTVRALLVCAGFALLLVGGEPAPAGDEGTQERAAPDPVALVARLGAESEAERSEAAAELTGLGAAAVPALVAVVGDTKLGPPAAGVIERIGPAAAAAVPALLDVVRGKGVPDRAPAMGALAAIGQASEPALNSLGVVLYSKAPVRDRVAAANAISAIGCAVARALPPSDPGSRLRPAVRQGFEWLLRHQGEDGSWSRAAVASRCRPERPCVGTAEARYDTGLTATVLVTLTHPGAPTDPDTSGAIARAVAHLVSRQDRSGGFGEEAGDRATYVNSMATLALARVAESGRRDLLPAVQRGADRILRSQGSQSGGWKYLRSGPDAADASSTAWAVRALVAAQDAGVTVDPAVIDRAAAWVDAVNAEKDGLCVYDPSPPGAGAARYGEDALRFPSGLSRSATACGTLIRQLSLCDAPRRRQIESGLAEIARVPPSWDTEAGSIDYYYWRTASECLVAAGFDSDAYASWRKPVLASLVMHQMVVEDWCDYGSWDPEDPWRSQGGRVYSTAFGLVAAMNFLPHPTRWKTGLPSRISPAVAAVKAASADRDGSVARAAARACRRIAAALVR